MEQNKMLAARFAAIKTRVAGNREKKEFEFTFGTPVEERNHITGLTADNKRILAEIQFALGLSAVRGGKYDGEIADALDQLEDSLDAEGVLTRSACREAEECLLPLAADAKEYEVIYASHAHIDMNWMWGWQETVAVTLSTFRTILNLMGEYPGFTFSQSQASVYKIVEEFDPEMMEEIKARIAEGRWEVTANAWVETDKNMPDTESLLRHISVTRDYLRDTWGVENVKVDFSPDTFGHSAFVPEINTFGNIPYYYHCRGLQDELTLYRFRAPSGSEVLMYKEPYWYNSGVNPDNGTGVFEMEQRCAGLKTALIVYGVGNHGGGPTRRDIETMLEMKQWPIFPTLKFGTIQEFFRKAEAVREKLPVIDHELNAIYTGCYTTQSRIKLGNRRTEAALLASEKISALAGSVLGAPTDPKRYSKAWEGVLFTHFHDILTGSGVQETREHAMGRLADSLAHAQSLQARAYERLSQAVDTSMFEVDDEIRLTNAEGAGVGYGIAHYAGVPNPERGKGKNRIYTVFNPEQTQRHELVELTVWDYNGDLTRLEAVDHLGNPVALQLLDKAPVKYWDHWYVRVLIEAKVKPMGCAVYCLREHPVEEYPTHLLHAEREELPHNAMVLENEYLIARFDTGSGMMHSLVDKATGEELLSAPAGLSLVRTSDEGMTAWRIGRYLETIPVTDTQKAVFVPGKLRSSIILEQTVMHSGVKLEISLDKGAKSLHYKLTVDWHEVYGAQKFIPVLSYRLPLKKGAEEILCDVPAGVAKRPARQIDVPALTSACAVTEGTTAALITDCKYGFRLADGVLSVTLINTSGDPDPYPERGIHAINLYVALTDGKAAALKNAARNLITPMGGVPTARHEGIIGPDSSLMEVKAAHTVISSVRMETDGALAVRLYEAEGADEEIVIEAPFAPAKAVLTDLDGNVTGEAAVKDKSVSFTARALRLTQVKMYR